MNGRRCEFVRVLVICALLSCSARLLADPALAENFTPDELARGQKMFGVHCARCHGIQGLGGVGPSLARPALPQAPDLKSLLGLIETGIPGTSMPSMWML